MTETDNMTTADGRTAAETGVKDWTREHPSLSPSRVADFQHCPLVFRYRSIDHMPEPQSSAAAKGTLVHAVLEELFTFPAQTRTAEQALRRLPIAWADMKEKKPEVVELFGEDDEEKAWLEAAEQLIRTYFTLEDPKRLEPEDREMLVDVELPNGVHLHGYIDRLDVAPGNGALRIVDYKTGKSPRPPFQAKALFQLKCYALALWRIRGLVPAMLQLVYLGNGDILRYQPTEADLTATEATLIAVWQAIEADARTGEFPPVTGPLCNWCAFKAQCPAFGGEQPPYPKDALARLGIH